MGVSIHLAISKSVTREEWAKVYEETLQLIRHFPMAEKRKVSIHGIDTVCLVRTEEREETCGWFEKKTQVGWEAVGDYKFMHTAEAYYFPRDLVGDDEVDPDAGDALLGALPAYMDYMGYDWDEEQFSHTYYMWGSKTQGEPYHIYLLAVAALVEARLGKKAFTYGDITRGQFRRAVEIANVYLDESIELPDACYMDRLFKRVIKLPLPPHEQMAVFDRYFLGKKDAEFGENLRQMFNQDAKAAYWKDRFNDIEIGSIGFGHVLYDYLLWGFPLGELCRCVDWDSEKGEHRYETFIRHIMDAKLYLKDKNCEDPLKIDQEEELPYGVSTLFAQFVFAGAGNKKVDRYISIEEIRSALKGGLDSKCDVDQIIDQYLQEEGKKIDHNLKGKVSVQDNEKMVEQDPAEVLSLIMKRQSRKLDEMREKYDIYEYQNIPFFRKGHTIRPELEESLVKAMQFLSMILEEEEYGRLLEKTAKECCQWLVEQNRYYLIRDEHWDKIFTDIENDRKNLERYYGLFRVRIYNSDLGDVCKGLLTNDELYDYSKGLAMEIE